MCFCSGSVELQMHENSVFFTPVKYTLVCHMLLGPHDTLLCVLIMSDCRSTTQPCISSTFYLCWGCCSSWGVTRDIKVLWRKQGMALFWLLVVESFGFLAGVCFAYTADNCDRTLENLPFHRA